jgi:hypothetical protein
MLLVFRYVLFLCTLAGHLDSHAAQSGLHSFIQRSIINSRLIYDQSLILSELKKRIIRHPRRRHYKFKQCLKRDFS